MLLVPNEQHEHVRIGYRRAWCIGQLVSDAPPPQPPPRIPSPSPPAGIPISLRHTNIVLGHILFPRGRSGPTDRSRKDHETMGTVVSEDISATDTAAEPSVRRATSAARRNDDGKRGRQDGHDCPLSATSIATADHHRRPQPYHHNYAQAALCNAARVCGPRVRSVLVGCSVRHVPCVGAILSWRLSKN